MELWNAYDEQMNIIKGVTLVRGDTLADGIFHLVCDIIVQHADKTYLLMQRDHRKHYGGLWEATAGGSAMKGENPLQCAIRELREETGIVSDKLVEVGKVIDQNDHAIYVEYLCETDWDKEKITLQEGETIDFKWVTKDELLKMKSDELVTERMQNFIEDLKNNKQ